MKMSQQNPKMTPKSTLQFLMEINKKIDILTETVNTLQGKVNELCTENNKVLQKEIKDVKDQTCVVLNVLAENTTAIKNNLKNCSPKFSNSFPIKSIEEFTCLENSIDSGNEKEYIASVRSICGSRGIRKSVADLVVPEVLNKFNIDGTHNKMRLLNFPKLMAIFFAGSYVDGNTNKSFKEQLRHGLKLAKNKISKDKIKSKKTDNEAEAETEKENDCGVKDHADDFFELQYQRLINGLS
ncbi:uncharacterized protein isoform X3 [Musca autumnalis]|uniref:uncharacterized protein isoform X3 n=1 Tax=Musca autumnalis TaxID=221902 RepID=UPI003CEE82A9